MIKKLRTLLKGDIAGGAANVVLATVATGAISYLVLLVAARILDPKELAEFVSIWAITNTIMLAYVLPVDGFGPRMRLESSRAGLGSRDLLAGIEASVVAGWAIVGAVLFLLVVLPGTWLSAIEGIAIAFFLLTTSLFGSQKAFLGSAGMFPSILRLSLVAFVMSLASMAFLALAGRSYWPQVFFAVGVAYILPIAIGRFVIARNISERERSWVTSVGLVFKETNATAAILSLVVVTFMTLLLSNGALIFAGAIGTPTKTTVVYAAMLNLALVPCTLLNAVTPPVHLRAIRHLSEGDVKSVEKLYVRAVALYGCALLVIVLGAAVVGPFAVRLYVGGEYSVSHFVCAGIACAEAIATMTVLPRIFLTATGRARGMTRLWALGVLVFGVVLLLPITPISRLILAPLAASIVILFVAHLQLRTALRVH